MEKPKIGRPPEGPYTVELSNIMLTTEMRDAVIRVCRRAKLVRSEFVRRAIRERLEKEGVPDVW